jgi:hypothetical protein
MPILGDGVSACCIAHVLGVGIEAVQRPRVPALIVSEATQRLISGVFGRNDIFAGLPRIVQRVVAWGGEPVAVPHSGVVMSEEELVTGLRPGGRTVDIAWTIRSSGGGEQQHFGTRVATASPVVIQGDPHTFWIESLEAGWLFLLPGWLLAVGGDVDEMLAASHLIAPRIAERSAAGPAWPAHPRIAASLCGEGWLACGTAAMAFDPICGDGVGNAVREGILAGAVVRSSDDPAALRQHYTARLTAAFRRHLELCREYYRTGGNSPWWRAELAALERGISWCGPDPEFCFRLNGFDLERASQAIL